MFALSSATYKRYMEQTWYCGDFGGPELRLYLMVAPTAGFRLFSVRRIEHTYW